MPDANFFTERLEKLTGMPVELYANPELSRGGKSEGYLYGRVKLFDCIKNDKITIEYNPRKKQYINAIVGHEAGHVERDWKALDKGTYKAMVSTKRGLRDHISHMAAVYAMGMASGKEPFPPENIRKEAEERYDFISGEMRNYPVDIRIERWLQGFEWLREELCGIILEQARLTKSSRSYLDGLRNGPLEIENILSPSRMYAIYSAPIAAYMMAMSRLIGKPGMIEPYKDTPLISAAQRLLGITDGIRDTGFASDVKTINSWASELGIRHWHQWLALPDTDS